jgi:hypothetical protein
MELTAVLSTQHNKFMRYATFINFTTSDFVAYWNGRPYNFKPGQKKEHLNEAIARHFAKHLANQVLQDGSIVDGEKYTSPKKPDEVPKFMEIFNKAFKIEGEGGEVDAETGLPIGNQDSGAGQPDQDEPSMSIQTKTRKVIDPYDATSQKEVVGPGTTPQVVGELSGDEEDNFEGDKNKK